MPRMGAISMRNVWLIAHREYVERVRTRGFLITTVMIPLIMCAFVGGSMFLGSRGATSDIRIAVVSSDTQLALDLQDELLRQQDQKAAQADASRPDGAQPKQPLNRKESPGNCRRRHRSRPQHPRGDGPKSRLRRHRRLPLDHARIRSRRPAHVHLHPTVQYWSLRPEHPRLRAQQGPHPRAAQPPRHRRRRRRHHAAARPDRRRT